MKRLAPLLAACIALCACVAAHAHPGAGLVVADDGTVFFADVGRETIWKLSPEGELTPLVRDRWTHALFLAADGTLYYEREIPNGGTAPCSLWRITPDGTHERLIAPQPDRRNFAGDEFVVDAVGNVYYAHSVRGEDGGWRVHLMRRTPEGEVTEFTGRGDGALFTDGAPDSAVIRIVTAMAMGPDGAIYFADRDHLRKVELTGERAGFVTTIATGLIDTEPQDPPERRGPSTTINRLYGLAIDADGRAIIAYQAGRRVIRVSADGTQREVIRRTPGEWSPLGVATRGEDVYVLEVADSAIQRLRVIRVGPDGESKTLTAI